MEKTTQSEKKLIKAALAGFVAFFMIGFTLGSRAASAHGDHDWEPKNRSEEPRERKAPFFTRVSPSDEISPRGRYIIVNGRQFYCDGVVQGEGC